MKRLKRGEYKNMTPEQQFEHRKKRRAAWEKKPGNKALVKRFNQEYQKKHWKQIANTLFLRKCKLCGKKCLMKGRRIICDECKSIPTKTQIRKEIFKVNVERRKARNNKIIWLALNTTLTQKEIAETVGTYQPVVSYILRTNDLRRSPYHKRNDNVKKAS